MSLKPTESSNQARLTQLTAAAQREHHAFESAFGNVLEHAMNAGDALLALRELVPPGQWQAYLRANTDISERSARVYTRVAKARPELSGSSAAGRPLSLRAALKYLRDDSEGSRKRSATKSKSKKSATSLDALGWWTNAPLEERKHFLDSVGLKGVFTAMPTDWRLELMRQARAAAAGFQRQDALTAAFKTALSLAETDPKGVHAIVSALRGIRNLLRAGGYDPDRIESISIEAGEAEGGRRAA